ncbi:hypothetical protein WMW72_26585 [Paenibacillus filicis]|uniref:Uncharacterized protein n=1 Tax=Paenibacillus filicis TaxID=669464 RepID=A0ABU9DRK2_9BACL
MTTAKGHQKQDHLSERQITLKMLYLATMDVLRKWTRQIQNRGQILLQLTVFHGEAS